MQLPMVCVVDDAKRNDINQVWIARGLAQPNSDPSFARALCAADPEATWETPATHWLMSDAGASDGEVDTCNQMTAGNLPPLPEGTVWGEDGVISAAAAMAATDGAVFRVFSCAGEVEPLDHMAAVLATLGLQFVPDPPL